MNQEKDELIKSLQSEVQILKKSFSFRLGRFLTAPLRIIVDSIRAFNLPGSKPWLFRQLFLIFIKHPGQTFRKINLDNISKLLVALKVENPLQTYSNSARYICKIENSLDSRSTAIMTKDQISTDITINNEPELKIFLSTKNDEILLNTIINNEYVKSNIIPLLSANQIFSIINSRSKKIVIAISHDNYLDIVGGVQNLMNKERFDFLSKSISYLQAHPQSPVPANAPVDNIVLTICLDTELLCNVTAREFILLGEMIARSNSLTVTGVVVHHILNWSIQALDKFLEKLQNVKVIFWLHDYFICCPQYNLLRNDFEFCHKPDIESNSCMICIYGELRRSNSKQFNIFLNNHNFTFLAPSTIVRSIIISEYPLLKDKIFISPLVKIIKQIRTRNNILKKLNDPSYKIKIAYLGRPKRYKGWDTWRSLVDSSVSDSYHCVYFSTEVESVKEEHVPINLLNKGKDSVINLLSDHNVDIVFLWSIWPETFSFTLYEAIAAGCFIITNPLSGNIAAYVRENSCGIILESERELITLLQEPSRLTKMLISFYDNSIHYAELEPNVETANLLLNK